MIQTSFQTYPKKYTLLKMADDPEDDEDQEEEEDDDMDEDDDEVESTLPQETQDFYPKTVFRVHQQRFETVVYAFLSHLLFFSALDSQL